MNLRWMATACLCFASASVLAAAPGSEAAAAKVSGKAPKKESVTVDANGIPQGEGKLYATLRTSKGEIVLELFEKEAPRTVANFVGLATGKKEWRHPKTGEKQTGRPYYDGTTFHRPIPNFMIQGGDVLSNPKDGDPARAGTGDPGYRFADEILKTLVFDRPGVLAMANSGPNTNGSQFFITEVATPHLNGGYTIFGTVAKGFEIVPKIAREPKGSVILEKVVVTRGTY